VLLAALAALVSPPRAAKGPPAPPPPTFEALYDRCFDLVFRNLRRLGVPAAGLDDAVQEVFLVVHRRFAEVEATAALEGWVFGVVLRVASDHRRALRRKSPHAQGGGPVDPETVVDERAPGAEEEVARRQAAARLHALLDELDEDKRAVFVMAELEQMTARAIGEVLGVSPNTVSARLAAARRDFEKAVARERARDEWRQR
jgi:RNA polymerase sigma-70 factor (ECF subfamily)